MISNIFLSASCFTSLVAFIIFFVSENNKNIRNQIYILYIIGCLFLSLALISDFSNKASRIVPIEAVCSFLPFLLILTKFKITRISLSKRIQGCFLVCVLFILLSLETLDDWMALDSLTYYTGIANAKAIDFTCGTLELLKLGGHRSYGATFFYLLGEFCSPNNQIGVRMVQIILLCSTIFMFSSILNMLKIDGNSIVLNLCLTSIYAFSPLILGTIYSINIDFMMMIFWIWMVFFFLKDKQILFVFSMLVEVFTKEVGVVIFCGFIAGILINSLIHKNKIGINRFIYYILPMLSFIAMWFLGGRIWFSSKNSTNMSLNGSGFSSFGINWISIRAKFMCIFILNFAWIITLLLVVCGIIILIRRKKRVMVCTVSNEQFIPIDISYLFFFLFNMLYITYGHPRYIMPGYFFLIILLGRLFSLINLQKRHEFIVLLLICLLMLIENYFTIDPLTQLSFKKVNIGDRSMVSTIEYTSIANKLDTSPNALQGRFFSHYMEYNRQFTYFRDAFRKALQTISYDKDTLVIIDSIFLNNSIDFSSLVMLGKEGGNNAEYYWNGNNIVYSDSFEKMNLFFVGAQDTDLLDYSLDYSEYKRVYYFSFPYNDEYTEFQILSSTTYPIIEEYSVLDHGWRIDIRRIK